MSRSHCLLVACSIALVLPASAAAQQPTGRTVEATGVASVKVDAPKDRTHEGPIRAAVEAAEAKALPRALADARAEAAELAKLSGLILGGVESISNTATTPYGPFGFYGSFGPDRFCGTLRTSVFKRGKDGKRHRVGSRTRHTCRVPSTVTSTLTVTFAAT
jgi:Protein of unknown function (DUF541)